MHPHDDVFYECSDDAFIDGLEQPPAAPPPAAPPPAALPTAASPPAAPSPTTPSPAVPPPVAPPPAAPPTAAPQPPPPRKQSIADDGYASDSSTCTTSGQRQRRAFLVAEGEDGTARHLAFGECRPADGVFVVGAVFEAGKGVDIAGQPLSGILNLQDLHAAELGFDWAEELEDEEREEFVASDGQMGEDPMDEDAAEMDEDAAEIEVEIGGNATAQATPAALASSLAASQEEAARWREQACELEDELQWLRDALDEAHTQLKLTPPSHAKALLRRLRTIRVRVDVDDPEGDCKGRNSKLITLEELVSYYPQGKALPILTSMERVRRAQMSAGMTKANYAQRQGERERKHKDELRKLRERHVAELGEQCRLHEEELCEQRRKHNDELQSLREWKRIEGIQQRAQAKDRHNQQEAAHAKELAARAKRTTTWATKRKNLQRTLRRAAAARDDARALASSSVADARAAEADNAALHAELGESIKVAAQRQHKGKRAPLHLPHHHARPAGALSLSQLRCCQCA